MRIIAAVLLIAFCPAVFGFDFLKPALNQPELDGDKYYSLSVSVNEPDAALAYIEKAIKAYETIIAKGKIRPSMLVKYVNARDFKLRYFVLKPSSRRIAYENLIIRFEPLGKRLSATKEYNYVMALLWGRRGEITQDTMEDGNKNIAEKIKFYGEALYHIDKGYQGSFSRKILGRVHYLTPNIPFVLGWPDKNKSKMYLKEFLKANPGNTEGKMYLADTLWALGDVKAAEKLYMEVVKSKPRKGNMLYDAMAIKTCMARMKKLNISTK